MPTGKSSRLAGLRDDGRRIGSESFKYVPTVSFRGVFSLAFQPIIGISLSTLVELSLVFVIVLLSFAPAHLSSR